LKTTNLEIPDNTHYALIVVIASCACSSSYPSCYSVQIPVPSMPIQV